MSLATSPSKSSLKLSERLSLGEHGRSRLRGALEAERGRLAHAMPDHADAPRWATAAKHMLDRATELQAGGKINEAWQALHVAQQFGIAGLDPPGLDACVASMRIEAQEKLTGWRQKAVTELLATQQGPAALSAAAAQARALLDEHYDNTYIKIGLVRGQLFALMTFLLLTLTLLGVLIRVDWVGTDEVMTSWHSFLTVAVLGSLGGSLSAVLSTARAGTRARVPDVIGDVPAALLRPFIGAASAVSLSIILQAGILAETPKEGAIYPFAIVAGFSEQALGLALQSSTSKITGQKP